MLRSITRLLCLSSLACLGSFFSTSDAQAQGYVYVPTSFYQSPPVYFYDGYYIPPAASLYTVAPAPPAPAVGYYQPLTVARYSAPVAVAPVGPMTVAPVAVAPVPMAVAPVYGRYRETWGGGPYANHYRYHVGIPGGPGYTYRERNVGRRTVIHERFR